MKIMQDLARDRLATFRGGIVHGVDFELMHILPLKKKMER